MGTPSRFVHGLNNLPPYHPLANYPLPFQLYNNNQFIDFHTYAAGDWTVTTTTGSTALAAGNGGLITQTTSNTSSDIQFNLKNPAAFQITSGQDAWFVWRGRVDTVANSTWQIGLQAGGTALAPTDGVYFTKAAAATTVSLVLTKASSSTTLSLGSGLVLADATNVVLMWYYNARTATVYAYAGTSTDADFFNSITSYYSAEVGQTTLTNLPTATNLAIGFGVQTNTAATRALTTDYIGAAVTLTR